jgi:hypothetical protein
MLLSPVAWAELIELGVLDRDDRILVEVAREPVPLCAHHAQAVAQTLQIDLQELAAARMRRLRPDSLSASFAGDAIRV